MAAEAMAERTAEQRRATLAALRATVGRLEGRGADAEAGILPTGLRLIDAVLPGGGLRGGALHEIVAASADAPAAEGFAATLLAGLARRGPVLWCVETASFYGPCLVRLGLSPERLILVRARRPADLLWAMEEGLRTPGLAAVLGEPASLDITASRRLQLAAEGSGVIGLVLSRAEATTVAVTRWRVTSASVGRPLAADERDFGLARARWQVELLRCRGAVPPEGADGFGRWLVEEGHAPSGAAAAAVRMPIHGEVSQPVAPAMARVIDFPRARRSA